MEQYQAGYSVIEENISEFNLLNSFDGSLMNRSIQKGENFKHMRNIKNRKR